MGDALGAMPEGRAQGLMVCGHRRKGDCNDIELAVTAITAPGGYSIRVLVKKNMQDKRDRITAKYGEERTVTLPAGSFLARVIDEGDLAPQVAELVVPAGERVELGLQ